MNDKEIPFVVTQQPPMAKDELDTLYAEWWEKMMEGEPFTIEVSTRPYNIPYQEPTGKRKR